ncbi:MAG: hypothetical protein INR63_32450, partial [Actinomycetospora chiangmaiensis]|nr:hypothetical protein [Actinomycetospora chiangmaiensis]
MRRARALLAAGLLAAAGAGRAAPAAPPPQGGEADDAGVHLRWTVTPLAEPGADGLAALDVAVTDGLGGTPLRLAGGRLYAWMQRHRGAMLDAEQPCGERVKALTGPGLGQRADIDLNDYRLLLLNADRNVLVINPAVSLAGGKLESTIALPGEPDGWLQVPERAEAWIALHGPARLVGLDLQAR